MNGGAEFKFEEEKFPFKRFRVDPSEESLPSSSPSMSSSPFLSSSSTSDISHVVSPLFLQALFPIRFLLHLFLTDEDAIRLLRVNDRLSRSFLPGYVFKQHVFIPDGPRHFRQMTALNERYGLRITRMVVEWDLTHPPSDDATPAPEECDCSVPSSLISLAIGSLSGLKGYPGNIFGPRATSLLRLNFHLPWYSSISSSPDLEEETDERRCQRLIGEVHLFPSIHFVPLLIPFTAPLSPPNNLHHGLRVLQLSCRFNSSLIPGSIPSTVQFLQLDEYNHPLLPDVLPHSLIHLVIRWSFNQPLPPGLLPPHLETFKSGAHFNQPLAVGSLPSSLRVIQLGKMFNRPLFPDLFPPGLLHLELFAPLRSLPSADVFPRGLVSLHLGNIDREPPPYHPQPVRAVQPLPVEYFPSSLRDLHLALKVDRPLVPGTLPEGLQFLRLSNSGYSHVLGAGVLPSTLIALDVSGLSEQSIMKRSIPPGLRFLKLPYAMDGSGLRLPATTQIVNKLGPLT